MAEVMLEQVLGGDCASQSESGEPLDDGARLAMMTGGSPSTKALRPFICETLLPSLNAMKVGDVSASLEVVSCGCWGGEGRRATVRSRIGIRPRCWW